MLQERIVLGEIVGAHGLRGELRVRIAGDAPDHLLAAQSVWLGRSAGDPEARRYPVSAGAAGRTGEVRLRLGGVGARADVEALIGLLVTAPASLLPALPDGEFYWYELIGCRVESESGVVAGTVREIWETGAHDVLMVEDEEGRRRLIPTASELMTEIDLEGGRIVVSICPGCSRRSEAQDAPGRHPHDLSGALRALPRDGLRRDRAARRGRADRGS